MRPFGPAMPVVAAVQPLAAGVEAMATRSASPWTAGGPLAGVGGAADGRRGYYMVPVPRVTADDVAAWATVKRRTNAPGAAPRGVRLNEHERRAKNKGVRAGFVQFGAGCGVALADDFYRVCVTRRRPYLALNAHGDQLVVDVGTVAGVFGEVDEGAARAVLDRFWGVLEAAPEEFVVAPVDGTKEDGQVDRDTEEFVVMVPKRAVGMRIAHELYAAFAAEQGVPTPADLTTAKEEKTMAEKAAWEAKMIKKLRQLSKDPVRLKKIPPGSLDKFLELDAEGVAETPGAQRKYA